MIDYDPHHWRSHLLDIQGSVVREIANRVLACALWSIVVVALVKAGAEVLEIPTTIHTLVGLALGLLLVFRTNVSYDRYWEGRRMWGNINNVSRDLARGVVVHLGTDPQRCNAVLGWIMAFARSAMDSLREQDTLGPIVAALPNEHVTEAIAARAVPLAIATRIGAELVEARDAGIISDIVLVHLDLNLRTMVESFGACERIKRTPMPYAYVVHLRRALILYCGTLPFALVKDSGWGAVLATLLITYVFLGVEEIGVEIENPFGQDANDLPLERFTQAIEADLGAMRRGETVRPER